MNTHSAPPIPTPLMTLIPHESHRGLRVAVLAPPWIAVPPPAYGGIEAVVALRCDGRSAVPQAVEQ